jgi:hypothetical protein
MRLGLVTVFALSASGCSLAMRPVQVSASHIQWEAVAGEWRGAYQMNGYDRHGTIAFKLVAVEEQASGEVLMIPERTGWLYTREHPNMGIRESMGPRTELLSIRFVEAVDGVLHGTMDPYWDPDRRCMASATFSGVVTGDSVSGELTSVCEGGVQALRGRWHARRNPPLPAAR